MAQQTKEFLALQAKWDKKLKDSGFNDAEQRDGNLKTWSSVYRLKHSDTTLEAKVEYYRAAGHFLYEYEFSVFEKKVWELHVQGISMRNIVKVLKERENMHTYRRKVHETVQRLVKVMMTNIRRDDDGQDQ